MLEECPVCHQEAKRSLRKHAAGKWLNNPADTGHLKLAIELTPGASAFLRDINFKEVADEHDGRHELPIVRGTIHRED